MRDDTKKIISIQKKISRLESEITGVGIEIPKQVGKPKLWLSKNYQYLFFLCYSRDDDYDGKITRFKGVFQKELMVISGKKVDVFQDISSIGWGENWKKKIEKNIILVPFLLPIITPSFFISTACRDELSEFINVEKDRHREDLILPVHYVTVSELRNQKTDNELIKAIQAHNYEDMRDLRKLDEKSVEYKNKVIYLAEKASEAINRL